jgi:hypothetical protein
LLLMSNPELKKILNSLYWFKINKLLKFLFFVIWMTYFTDLVQ